MLQIFFGTAVASLRDAAQIHIKAREAAGVQVSRVESSTYEPGVIENALGATSLFGGSALCVIDSPSELADFKVEIEDSLAALSESNTEFVIITGGLTAAEKKRYTAVGAMLHEHSAPPKPRENTFALTEALAEKDKKNLWLLYQEAVVAGKSAEEIIGLLWWQLKALRLATLTTSGAEAGMKDFPYQKARQALKNFKPGEIESLSTSLLSVYHDGHAGLRDINIALESWLLELR